MSDLPVTQSEIQALGRTRQLRQIAALRLRIDPETGEPLGRRVTRAEICERVTHPDGSEMTIHQLRTILESDEYRDVYAEFVQRVRGDHILEMAGGLASLVPDAIEALGELLRNKRSPMARLGAAREIINHPALAAEFERPRDNYAEFREFLNEVRAELVEDGHDHGAPQMLIDARSLEDGSPVHASLYDPDEEDESA